MKKKCKETVTFWKSSTCNLPCGTRQPWDRRKRFYCFDCLKVRNSKQKSKDEVKKQNE